MLLRDSAKLLSWFSDAAKVGLAMAAFRSIMEVKPSSLVIRTHRASPFCEAYVYTKMKQLHRSYKPALAPFPSLAARS